MYVEEADAEGNVLEGADITYATSNAPSPTKERMNTKKTRRGDSQSPGTGLTDSDRSTVHPRREARLREREKEKSKEKPQSSGKTVRLAPRPATRPSTKSHKTSPIIQSHRRSSRDDASYYAAETVTPAATVRPRAQTAAVPRPTSYYGPSANRKYYAQQPPTPVAGGAPISYPPQQWAAAGPVAAFPVGPPPSMPYQQPDYFSYQKTQSSHLANRFNRPASAMGHRPSLDYGAEYDSRPVRRASLTRRPRAEDDRDLMPPPPRPSTTRPPTLRTSMFAPPPPRRSIGSGFDDESFQGDPTLYQDVSPLSGGYEYPPPARVPRTRRPSIGATSITYDHPTYSTEVAGRSSRRNSYYAGQPVSSGGAMEDKLRMAASYQEDVSGGPTLPLTAESLRKASKRAGASSRSTRSSASHEESDWRQSATTRTTRSSNEEDVTIRVKGQATLEYAGGKVQCKDGAEINISSGMRMGRMGSDRSSYMGGEDRRTRIDRPSGRARATSQAASYSRTTPGYESYGYNIDYSPPAALPYPPQTYPTPPNWV
jgi:hypothetical protein